MKTYLSRREASEKFNVSIPKLRRWEEKGSLRRVDANHTEQNANRAGSAVRWVYDEEQIRALVESSPSKNVVSPNRELEVFELLDNGKNVIEICRQTKLPVKEVQRLRDIYLVETKGLYLPPQIIKRIADLRFELTTPESVFEIIDRLYRIAKHETRWRMKAEKLGGVRVAPRSNSRYDPDPWDTDESG